MVINSCSINEKKILFVSVKEVALTLCKAFGNSESSLPWWSLALGSLFARLWAHPSLCHLSAVPKGRKHYHKGWNLLLERIGSPPGGDQNSAQQSSVGQTGVVMVCGFSVECSGMSCLAALVLGYIASSKTLKIAPVAEESDTQLQIELVRNFLIWRSSGNWWSLGAWAWIPVSHAAVGSGAFAKLAPLLCQTLPSIP